MELSKTCSFYYNHISSSIVRKSGKLFIYRNAVIDIHETAKIKLNADFYINSNKFKKSRAESFLKMHEGSTLNINGNFKLFYDSTIQIFKNAELTLNGGYINSNSVIACSKNIEIGEGSIIARGVYIYDGDHHSIYDGDMDIINKPNEIKIGKHVWIGVNSVILKGVTIGEGSIVAAGSVVTKSIPSNCMVAGVPAKIIKREINWR